MRGVGTLLAGMLVLVGLVALTVYIVHVSRMATQTIHEQQQLYEKARYIAEHANISGNVVSLPEHADMIIIDPSGIPHVAKNVTQLELPWPTDSVKIYVAKRGNLRVSAADPVATALSAAASVAAAPLTRLTTPENVSCEWYLDPVIYNITHNATAYRGYIPYTTETISVSVLYDGRNNNCYPVDGATVREWLGTSLVLPSEYERFKVCLGIRMDSYAIAILVDKLRHLYYITFIDNNGNATILASTSRGSTVVYYYDRMINISWYTSWNRRKLMVTEKREREGVTISITVPVEFWWDGDLRIGGNITIASKRDTRDTFILIIENVETVGYGVFNPTPPPTWLVGGGPPVEEPRPPAVTTRYTRVTGAPSYAAWTAIHHFKSIVLIYKRC